MAPLQRAIPLSSILLCLKRVPDEAAWQNVGFNAQSSQEDLKTVFDHIHQSSRQVQCPILNPSNTQFKFRAQRADAQAATSLGK